MDDLPELPFEKVLSYLSLQDHLRLSAVSRSCHQKVTNSRVKSLCYSSRPIGFIHGKSRWVSGPFAQNFISSTRFASFFNTYGQTILSSLKHLRLCDLDLSARNETAFARTLNSFGQLEELDIIRAQCGSQRQCKLNLPMLTSIQLEKVKVNRKLILDAPRLREVRAMDCYDLRVEIVHGESVESLITSSLTFVEVKKLKNLNYLYVDLFLNGVDSTFLSSLKQLKEVHLNYRSGVSLLYEQKRRYDRTDLKIYLCGLLQSGLNDPPLRDFIFGFPEDLGYLIENPSKVADVMPFYRFPRYFSIERVGPEVPINLMNKFTGLNTLSIDQPVQNIERLLDLLKKFQNIVELWFEGTHSQELFDRLPEHCAVQKLIIINVPSDLGFLFRLKHLIHLDLHCLRVDVELIRKAFEKLPFLSFFRCYSATIDVRHPKQFRVSLSLSLNSKTTTVSDLNAVIQFIVENQRPKKRKVDEWQAV